MLIEINLPDEKLGKIKPLMALLKEDELSAYMLQALVSGLSQIVLRQINTLAQAAVADINGSIKPDGTDTDPYIKIKPGK